jgi:hypothetical protein
MVLEYGGQGTGRVAHLVVRRHRGGMDSALGCGRAVWRVRCLRWVRLGCSLLPVVVVWGSLRALVADLEAFPGGMTVLGYGGRGTDRVALFRVVVSWSQSGGMVLVMSYGGALHG